MDGRKCPESEEKQKQCRCCVASINGRLQYVVPEIQYQSVCSNGQEDSYLHLFSM